MGRSDSSGSSGSGRRAKAPNEGEASVPDADSDPIAFDRAALRRVAGLLDRSGLAFGYDVDSGCIVLRFEMKRYRDRDGERQVTIVLRACEAGGMLIATVHSPFAVGSARCRRTARKAILQANYAMRVARIAVNHAANDRVVMMASIPIGDIEVDGEFLRRQLERFVGEIELCGRLLRRVWKDGKDGFRRTLAEEGRVRVMAMTTSSVEATEARAEDQLDR